MPYKTYKGVGVFSSCFIVALHAVSALPANFDDSPSNVNISSEVINSWLSKRVSLGDVPNLFVDSVPWCRNADPSYAPLPIQAQDGSGTKMQEDDCSDHDGDYCWTSYFMTNTEFIQHDWEDTGAQIDCTTAAICGIAPTTTYSLCTDINFGGGDRPDITDYIKNVVYAEAGDLQVTENGGNTTFCVNQTPSQTCQWTDQQCHQIWKKVGYIRLHGYMRRSCTSTHGGAQIAQNAQYKNNQNAYTMGMLDLYLDLPATTMELGCGALCNQTPYPG